MNTYMGCRICDDKCLCVHYRRPTEEGEIGDSKQDIWTIVIPGDDVSSHPEEVQQLAKELWTLELIQEFRDKYGL